MEYIAMSKPQHERRKAPRARVHLKVVEYRDNTTYLHPVEYLSATGMLMRDASFTLDRLLDTADIDLELGLPGLDRPMRVLGRIARIEPTDDGELGVGVEFQNVSDRDAEALDAYVRGVLDGTVAAQLNNSDSSAS